MKSLLSMTVLIALGALVMTGCECGEEPQPYRPPEPAPAKQPAEECPPMGNVLATMALPTGERETSVLFVEKTGPEMVMAGEEFTYNIKITNLRSLPVNNVLVTEELDDRFQFALQSTTPEADNKTGQEMQWRLGTIEGGQSKTITVNGIAKTTGSLVACTIVTFAPPKLCINIEAVQPVLEIAKTGPDEVLSCDPIVYNITVKNTGTGTACNVVLTDNLPDGLTNRDGSNNISRQLGNIEPGESRNVTIQAMPNRTGTVNNQAMAKADGNVRAESGQVATNVVEPVLEVAKTGPDMRYVGRPATFDITVKNTGDAAARDTVLTDQVPAGAQFVSATNGGTFSNGTITWNLGTLEQGDTQEVSVTLKPTQKGFLTNRVTASAYCAKGSAETTLEVKGIPAILLECIDLADPIEVGAKETYEIRVTNQGSADDKNVQIVVTLPEEQEFISAQGPTKEQVDGKTITFRPLASLDPKAQATWRVNVRGTKPGDVRFKVELTSDMMTKPAMETESTHIYE